METDSAMRRAAGRGLLLIVLSAVLWGTVGVVTKLLFGLAETGPLSVGFWRLVLAAPALLLAAWATLGAGLFRVKRADLARMLVIGATTAVYQVCYFAAIQRVGVSVAVLITLCTAPVIVALLSAPIFREPLTRWTLLALALALGGTALLVGAGGPAEGADDAGETVAGVLLALASAFGYAAIAMASRALAAAGYHPLQPITIGFGAGALFLLPFALATGLTAAYPAAGWGLLLYLGLVPTALAYTIFLVGLRHTTATTASIVTLVEPLTSTVLAALFFGERLGPHGLLGAALLLGAIAVLYRRG